MRVEKERFINGDSGSDRRTFRVDRRIRDCFNSRAGKFAQGFRARCRVNGNEDYLSRYILLENLYRKDKSLPRVFLLYISYRNRRENRETTFLMTPAQSNFAIRRLFIKGRGGTVDSKGLVARGSG